MLEYDDEPSLNSVQEEVRKRRKPRTMLDNLEADIAEQTEQLSARRKFLDSMFMSFVVAKNCALVSNPEAIIPRALGLLVTQHMRCPNTWRSRVGILHTMN